MVVKFLEFMTRPENAQLTIGATEPILPVIKGVEAVDMPCAEELMSFVPQNIMYIDWVLPERSTMRLAMPLPVWQSVK